MQCFVGTSGFSYKEWKGTFYPEKIRNEEMLTFYADRLTAVEINNTFYRMPRREVLQNWSNSTPSSFRFILKASRRITHFKHLKDADEPMHYLLQSVSVLGSKLGALLFQLPPALRCDLDRLERFLELIPPELPVSFEFRNESWFQDEVFDRLRARNIAICHADGESELPFVTTADWGYLRLRKPGYDEETLQYWLGLAQESGWQNALVFFKHEEDGAGPALAQRFLSLHRENRHE